MPAIDFGISKSQSDSISYSRTETGSQTVTKTNNVKLGGGNINNVYLGTNKVKAIYLGDNLIFGSQTTYYDKSAKYTLSIEIDNDHSLSNEAKFSTYSYIVDLPDFVGQDDPVEKTVNTYVHDAYSYIRYLVTSGRVATPSDLILPKAASYSVSKGSVTKYINRAHSASQYELMVYNSPVTPNANLNGPIPFAQFSVYTDYQKLNCNIWRSNWYTATEPPTDTPQNSTATITLSSSVNGSSTLKCVGVTLVLRPANTNKTISLGVNSNGTITGNATVVFDNLTNGTTNTIQLRNFRFADSTGNSVVPSGHGNLIAIVDGISTTIYSGSLGGLSGSLSLDCPENGKGFIISIRIQRTS